MKLEYNILWIDNDLQSYVDNGSVKSIENFLSERGFKPTIEKMFDESELDDYILKHNYDLIISDYNLEDTTGDKIIEDIRITRKSDADILFYTAQGSYKSNPEVIQRLAFIERLTFQVGRDTLLGKIENVIELTLKKLLELNATRGLITASTSELDIEIKSLVMRLIEKQNLNEEALKEIIEEKVVTPWEKNLQAFRDNYHGFQKYFDKMDAIKKWEIFRDLLRDLLKQKPLNAKKEIAEFIAEF